MAAHITLARIQRAIERAGIPLTLFRGEGYQYFEHHQPARPELYRTTSIYVCWISDYTIDEWLEQARRVWSEMELTFS